MKGQSGEWKYDTTSICKIYKWVKVSLTVV